MSNFHNFSLEPSGTYIIDPEFCYVTHLTVGIFTERKPQV